MMAFARRFRRLWSLLRQVEPIMAIIMAFERQKVAFVEESNMGCRMSKNSSTAPKNS